MGAPAIVLAVAVPGAGPRDRLAGLPLALRTVLGVQSAGATHVTLIVAEGDEATDALVRGDARVKVPLEVISVTAGAEPIAAARGVVTGPTLVASHDVIAKKELYKALLGATLDGSVGVAACEGDELLGPMLVGEELFEAFEEGGSFRDCTKRLLAAGRVRASTGEGWAYRVTDAAGRERAFDQLFEDCRKPLDGIVSRRLNRHISIFVSKRLVDTPLSPNAATLIAFSFGLVGAAMVAHGGYLWTVAGAALFQWNSIVDGVDGELARVRYQHSKLGQWLDTVLDDVANVVFWACLGIGSARLPYGEWLTMCGWISAGANLGAACIAYAELLRVGSGDWYDLGWDFRKQSPSLWRKVVTAAGYVTKKDFFIFFCLCLACAGVLPYALPVFAVAAVGTLATGVVRAGRGLMRRRRAPQPGASEGPQKAPS